VKLSFKVSFEVSLIIKERSLFEASRLIESLGGLECQQHGASSSAFRFSTKPTNLKAGTVKTNTLGDKMRILYYIYIALLYFILLNATSLTSILSLGSTPSGASVFLSEAWGITIHKISHKRQG
jgi:hypothetical protein